MRRSGDITEASLREMRNLRLMSMTLSWLRKKRVWVGLGSTSCVVVLLSHLPLFAWIAGAGDWIGSQGVWATPSFVAIYVVAAVMGLPNVVLIVAAGSLFGLSGGVVSASIADTLSIAACFGIGQSLGRRWITRSICENSRFHQLDRAFASKGWKIVLLTRLSPLLPSNILNYGFSVTRINLWEYLFFSWLGMLPIIFTYVYIGAFGATMFMQRSQPENIAFHAVGLLVTVGVMVYTTRLTTAALKPPH